MILFPANGQTEGEADWSVSTTDPKAYLTVPGSSPMKCRLCSLLLLAAGLALFQGTPSTSFAQTPPTAPSKEKWEIRPTYEYDQSTINVAQFNTTNTSIDINTLPKVIRRDLELTGFFKMPENQKMANQQNIIDNKKGNINFGFWKETLKVEHYLMGKVTEQDGYLTVTVLLYDIPSQRVIMKRNFSDTKEKVRLLGHRISDEVLLQLKGIEGVATTKLIFVSSQIPRTKEVAAIDWDGFNMQMLTHYDKLATMPTWGSKGTEMYFTSYHGNRANIYGMQLPRDAAFNLVAGSTWTIAAYGGTNHSPSWNEKNRRIALVLSKDGNSEIYTSDRGGKDLRRLSTTRYTEGSPTWSPDGSKVAFTSNDNGQIHLYIMNADGSGRKRITTKGSWNDAVSWSPEGSRLAYVKRSEGKNDIYIADAAGEETYVRRLTMGQGNNESPSWAPNGTHLAYSSDRSGRWHLYVMLDDGSNQRQITTQGSNTMPDWGPVPPQKK